MPRKPHLILLVLVALAVLVLLVLPEHTRSRVRMAFGSLFLPLFGLASSVQAAAERATSATPVIPRASLVGRLEDLRRDHDRLQLTLAELRIAAQENDRLRQMLGYAPRAAWRLKPARVIGRDPANWWRSVHLDVGLKDGITHNLPVLTPEGLVGRVAEAGAHTCRVVLVGDPNCPVAAVIQENSETGIIRGASGGDIHGSLVDLSYLSRNALVKPGQRVATSGQGGVFPRGIAVGEVVDARAVGDGVYLEARVRLTVNLGALDHVWVKLP